jgi:hypothetical protein
MRSAFCALRSAFYVKLPPSSPFSERCRASAPARKPPSRLFLSAYGRLLALNRLTRSGNGDAQEDLFRQLGPEIKLVPL